jgi:hypothetical protein
MQPTYNPDFAEYVKDARSLRLRIRSSVILIDSLRVLKQRYGIDPEEEYTRMQKNPEAWIDLINALKENSE